MANKTKSKTKIYFWLKLDENFFKNIVIKKARKSPGGDTMVIIYQRLMLQSLSTEGILYYEGALENLSEELSLSLDEEIEKIQMTLAFFSKFGLIQIDENDNADMLQVHALVDQETDWARYKRKSREKSTGHTPSKLDNVQPVSNDCPTDIELDIEEELEKEIDIESDTEKEKPTSVDNDILFKKYMDLFINFAKKNINKRSLALQTFIKLSEMEKNQIITGAKNYINFYKSDRPDDESGQYSINAFEFLDNAVFKEYQPPIITDTNPYKYSTDVHDPKGWGKTKINKSLNTDINYKGGWG